jgi:hypothetical protein
MEKKVIRIRHRSDSDQDNDLKGLSPGDLMGMMWQLTLNAWSFRMRLNAEPRLQRNVVMLTRGKG